MKVNIKDISLNLLLLIPIVNLSFDFFLSSYEERSSIVLSQYLILIVILFVCFLNKRRYKKIDILIYSFLIYLLISVYFSSDVFTSFNYFVKVSIPYLVFIISYEIVNNYEHFRKIILSVYFMSILYFIYILIVNYFNIGDASYRGDDAFTVGYVNGMRLYQIILPFFLLPLINDININKKYKLLIIIIIILLFIILPVITLRRILTISLILGCVIFIFLIKNKTPYFLKGVVLFISLFIISLFFLDFLEQRFLVRESKFLRLIETERLVNEESRFQEFEAVYDDIDENVFTFIFGTSELFNSRNQYGDGFKNNRRLHVDYTLLLHGGGMVALGLYLLIIIKIFLLIRKYSVLRRIDFFDKLYSIGFSLLVISVVIAFTGGIESISYRSLLFLILGSICGVMREEYSVIKKRQLR